MVETIGAITQYGQNTIFPCVYLANSERKSSAAPQSSLNMFKRYRVTESSVDVVEVIL